MPATMTRARRGTSRLRPRNRFALTVLCAGLLGWPAPASALRRLFEPTDLELEEAGVAEVDLQFGVIRGAGSWRLSVPDFEVDLGLWRDLELDLDGALSWEGPDGGAFRLDHLDDDNLWVALKTSLLSFDFGERGIALGAQVGPKCPTARGARGFGVEGLLLGAWHTRRLQLVLNGGMLWDPSDGTSPRPLGLEGGLDANLNLDDAGHLALVGEAGGVRFLSHDPRQLTFTAGVAWDPRDDLELSVVGLAGVFEGSDRFGLLFGISPKLGK